MPFPTRTLPLIATLALFGASAGCASAVPGIAAAADAPVVSASRVAEDRVDDEGPTPLPTLQACEEERLEIALADGDDDRCGEEIVASAAMAYLFVGTADVRDTLSVASYESGRAIADALDEPEFQRILRRADAVPRDGRLERHEALELERRVAKLVEAR